MFYSKSLIRSELIITLPCTWLLHEYESKQDAIALAETDWYFFNGPISI